MKQNVIKMSLTKDQKRFREEYPRMKVACEWFEEAASEHEEYFAEDSEPFYLPGTTLKRVRYYPAPQLSRLVNKPPPIPRFNQAILVGVLGRLYEKPDMTCTTQWAGDPEFPFGWGFAFQLPQDLIAVIAGQLRETRVMLYRRGKDPRPPSDAEATQFKRFLADLHLLHEGAAKQFKGVPASHNVGYRNLFREKYAAGRMMLRLAKDGDTQRQIDDLNLDVLIGNVSGEVLESHGFLELSAGVFFFMALEGLINLTYAVFVKEPIRESVAKLLGKELVIRMDCIHLLCDEFGDRPPFSKDLMKRVTSFRDWRNKVVHADVLEDDVQVFSWLESEVPVYFAPAFDRGEGQPSQKPNFSRFQATIATGDVEEMKKIVDDCKSSIVAALSPAGKEQFAQIDSSTTVLRSLIF